MKRFLLLALLLGGCTTTDVNPVVFPPDASGIGAQTCQQWVNEHAAKTPQAEAQTEWLLDVFRSNGLKIEEKDSWFTGVWSKRHLEFAANVVCKDHPRRTIRELANGFVKGAKQRLLEAATG